MAAKFPSAHGPSATSTPMPKPREREEITIETVPRVASTPPRVCSEFHEINDLDDIKYFIHAY